MPLLHRAGQGPALWSILSALPASSRHVDRWAPEQEKSCYILIWIHGPLPVTPNQIPTWHGGAGLSLGFLILVLFREDFPGLSKVGCKGGKGACPSVEGRY